MEFSFSIIVIKFFKIFVKNQNYKTVNSFEEKFWKNCIEITDFLSHP